MHFATKLSSRDIKNVIFFRVPFYDLFASDHKTVFPTPQIEKQVVVSEK